MRSLFSAVLLSLISISVNLCNNEDHDMQKIVNQLIKIVEDPSQPMDSRIKAAQLLGKLGEQAKETIPTLLVVLQRLRGRELEPLQVAIVDSLGRMGYAARIALPTFAIATGRSIDIDQAITRATESILNATDQYDVASLTKQLESKDPSQRLRAVDALRRMGRTAKEAMPAVMALLDDEDYIVRNAAIEALMMQINGNIPESVIRAIAKDLNEIEPGRRLLALYRLGKIGPASAIVINEIDKLRDDPDASIRRIAQEVLNRILGKTR